MPCPDPGVYLGLPEAEYHAAEALSCSGAKKLLVSPLHYWHHCLNPDRAVSEPTPAMRLGSAVHGRLLEPDLYPEKYAREFSPEDHPGALDTMEDMREWLAGVGLPTSGTRKQVLVDRILASGLPVGILAYEKAIRGAADASKVVLPARDFATVERVAASVLSDPHAAALLTGGIPEASIFVRDPESGVMLKGRLDYLTPRTTIDLKTFTNTRSKPLDQALNEIICFEKYYLQYVWYETIRELAREFLEPMQLADSCLADFVFLFVESSEPHEVRLVQMCKREGGLYGQDTFYYEAGRRLMGDAIDSYALSIQKFGSSPWREPGRIRRLVDQDLPQSMFF